MGESQHWADQLAQRILARAEAEAAGAKPQANVKCQQTPSGGKHIGNLNDVIRAWFPCKAARELGLSVSFVHTTDDRDPLKDVPKRLPALDGSWSESAKLMDLKPFLGKPLVSVPDPFGCCKSWAAHFTQVWMEGVRALGMKPELHSVDQLYRDGEFEPYIRMIFENLEEAQRIVGELQESKGDGYIPFDAICGECGVLANVDKVDIAKKSVHFVCGGKSIKKKKSGGCGNEAWQPWSEGKLQWRFEWPSLMAMFNTTYEPFGKDHAEGSWKSVLAVFERIFKKEPPIPYVYEFFLVNGQKMSASVGNVYIVQDLLELVEPEVFSYFYTKRPGKQRDLDLAAIQLLVEDFEHAERVYFGAEQDRDAAQIKRSYELAVPAVPAQLPFRIPYLFASMIAQLGLSEAATLELLQRTGHLKAGPTAAQREAILKRVRLAGNWAKQWAPDQYRFRLQESVLDVIKQKLLPAQRNAVREFAGQLKPGMTEEQLTQLAFDVAKEHAIPPAGFFQACYWLLLARASGPRLSHVILAAGAERAKALLEQA